MKNRNAAERRLFFAGRRWRKPPAVQLEWVRVEDGSTGESRKRPPSRSAPHPGGGIGPLIPVCYINLA